MSLSDADRAWLERELADEERRWRASGKKLVGQIDAGGFRAATGVSSRRLPATWTPIHVLDRLEEAFEILGRLPMTTRPRGHSNSMPVYAYDRGDLNAQVETGELERLARARNNYRVRGATAAEVVRMEQALSWPSEYLADRPEVARALQLAALWASVKADQAKRAKARGYDPQEFFRLKIEGMNAIAAALVRAQVVVS